MRIRLSVISDTHNQFKRINLIDSDILIHCGDITSDGSLGQLRKFAQELGSIEHKFNKILIVPGNRDSCFLSDYETSISIISPIATVLINEGITTNKLSIYGTPNLPTHRGHSFEKSELELVGIFDSIPEGLDILVTHTPPKWVLDFVHTRENVNNVGCQILYKYINQKKPQLCVFGHIHESYGYTNINNITYINASICDSLHRPVNKPFIIDYDTITKTCHLKV